MTHATETPYIKDVPAVEANALAQTIGELRSRLAAAEAERMEAMEELSSAQSSWITEKERADAAESALQSAWGEAGEAFNGTLAAAEMLAAQGATGAHVLELFRALRAPSKAAPLAEQRDKGPWKAGCTDDKRVFIESADFDHDVRLYVDGDFANLDQKTRYAIDIADQLNSTPAVQLRADGVVGIDWSMVRSILMQGAAIQQDYQAGKFATYEHYSARMDAAARERIDELSASPAAAKEWKRGEGGDWIDGVVLDIAELPDRSSPPDQPEMLLVTAAELREAIDNNAPHALPGDRHE